MKYRHMAVGALVVSLAGTAAADSLVIDLTGWSAAGGWGDPMNSSMTVSLGAGTEVNQVEFIDVQIEALGDSWATDFVFSVNDGDSLVPPFFWDARLPGATNSPGLFGPASGQPGAGSLGGPFIMTEDDLYIEAYTSWLDPINVLSGSAVITYTAVPAPGALALLALAGIVGLSRRRH